MKNLSEFLPVIIYVLLFAGIKLSERFFLTRPENTIRREWGDWTVWFILIPLWLVLIGPVLEFFVLDRRPEVVDMIAGGMLFIAAGFFAIKGYFDLQHGFTQAIEDENTSLVVTGLYHVIRHPISLGNVLFCVACPLFLAAGPSWIAALVCILGIVFRISVEESFLQTHIPDYKTYKKRTWALIPYIY
jgi:protein-S-isoprenylcysteine O-methyltransferase Ste14